MINQLAALAFAAGAVAIPHVGHNGAHKHAHNARGAHVVNPAYTGGSWSSSSETSAAPFPYPVSNSTSMAGTTAPSSGFGSSSTSLSSAAPYSEASASSAAATTAAPITYTDVYGNSAAPAASASSGSDGECGADVTVTTTLKETVYVTAGASSSSSRSYTSTVYVQSTSYVYAGQSSSSTESAAASSSAPAAYVPSSSASTQASAAASSSSSSSSSLSSSSSVSSYVAPTSYSETSTSSAAASSDNAKAVTDVISSAVASVTSAVASYLPASSSASSSSSYSSSASSTSSSAAASSSSTTIDATTGFRGGKRGLAYQTASLTECFVDSNVFSWGYNWVSASAGLSTDIQFIPTLHSMSSEWTSVWSTEVDASITAGAKTVFSFNEPDEASQANLSPSAAAAGHLQYVQPLKSKGVNIVAPSVTNGNGVNPPMGLDWLLEFFSSCGTQCDDNHINLHWYWDNDHKDDFLKHVKNATDLFPGRPIWITEFALNGASDDEVTSFLEEVMPELDGNSNVLAYAYYYVNDGMLVSGTSASSYGSVYMSSSDS